VNRRVATFALAVSLVTLAGCGGDPDPGADPASTAAPAATTSTPSGPAATSGRLVVATTVAPITNIVANVAGDRATVTGIVPEGTNSHTFEPPPSAVELLSRADVVFVNGLKLEDPTLELAEANTKAGARIVEIGTRLLPEREYIYDFSFPKEEGKPNPHLWTDPTYVLGYAEVVRDTLRERDPAGAATYERNAGAFAAKVNALSEALRVDQETVPPERRLLLTYHDAYAYFARTYGWKVLGAVQPEDFEDPAPREVSALIDQIKAHKVPTIFGSEVFPSKVLEQIGRESGARYEDTLRDDDLPGKPGDPEHSWLGLMRYDFTTMIRGLGGTTTNLDRVDVSDVVPDRATYPQ
jgi:ABC-type Zn uptake system ZnuABC Zn-binding protein ZnuA